LEYVKISHDFNAKAIRGPVLCYIAPMFRTYFTVMCLLAAISGEIMALQPPKDSSGGFLSTPHEANGQPVSLPKILIKDTGALTLVGAGLRKKKVVFVNVSVYVAAHYVGLPADWNPAQAAASLKKQPHRQMTLTFLRDVGADKIKDAFSDSLTANGHDPARADLAAALKALAADVKEGGQISFVGSTEPGKPQRVWITGSTGRAEVAGATVVDDLWSMWFGKPVDGGIEQLQTELLTPLK